ncbi:hypothetical protein M758_UG267300 [Ceratodon purpureus]|nr:hypothetical protein M758_UG267300 [Ceratodon purpureus]
MENCPYESCLLLGASRAPYVRPGGLASRGEKARLLGGDGCAESAMCLKEAAALLRGVREEMGAVFPDPPVQIEVQTSEEANIEPAGRLIGASGEGDDPDSQQSPLVKHYAFLEVIRPRSSNELLRSLAHVVNRSAVGHVDFNDGLRGMRLESKIGLGHPRGCARVKGREEPHPFPCGKPLVLLP